MINLVDPLSAPGTSMGPYRRRRRCHARCDCFAIRLLPKLIYIVELRVKTVKYFKSIEKVQEEVEAMQNRLKGLESVNGDVVAAEAASVGIASA